jgi:putative transposase
MSGHRQSLRLHDVDYGRTGLYFVTLVTEGRETLLGKIINQCVHLSPSGEIVKEEWLKTPIIRPGVTLDEWQIMPDHFLCGAPHKRCYVQQTIMCSSARPVV